MLEHMTEHSRPTRAEVTDVANAIIDGTDFVMLSAETAVGRFPYESVLMMNRIIRFTEESMSELKGA
jgi:pyruvate kinase